jgi:integrase
MNRTARLGLGFDDWPDAWQAMWRAAVEPAEDMFGVDGAGAHWAPDTRREIRKRLGQFFGFLRRMDGIDPSRPLGEFLTEPYLRPYVDELSDRVASVTRAGYLRDLMIGIKAMDAKVDTATIHMVVRRLERRARASRDKRAQHVAPRVLYKVGIARMVKVETAFFEKEDVRALQYGDGLAMAIVACSLDRRRNLVGIRLGDNLRRVGDCYRLAFAGSETKGGHPHACDLPARLTPYIEHYLQRHRTKLLGPNLFPDLFISAYRRPMSRQTFYCRFTEATRQELGVAIPPHRIRDSAVTAIAEDHPDAIGIAPALLHHRQTRITNDYYNLADQISASRRYNVMLTALRKKALAASRKGELFPRGEEK